MNGNLTLEGISTDQIKAILTIAQNLQKNYDVLGSPGSQNVRNPRPLRQLIAAALPVRRNRAVTRAELMATLERIGYRVGSRIHLAIELRRLIRNGAVSFTGLSANAHTARFWFSA